MTIKLGRLSFLAAFAAICVCGIVFEAHAYEGISRKNLVKIMRAEDELRFDKTLVNLLKNKDRDVRVRAALAAGRIGDKSAIPILVGLMTKDSEQVAQMAAFAIGEIESTDGAAGILSVLNDAAVPTIVRARAVEAAGKIVAADSESDFAKDLGNAILQNLSDEYKKSVGRSGELILLGITAVLRSKPVGGEEVLTDLLASPDKRVRADAANAIGRLRGKGANIKLRSMLADDADPIARANAARALGSAEDTEAEDLLLKSALNDSDSRVRVGAIGALGRLKSTQAGAKLVIRAEQLFADYKKSNLAEPVEINELLTLASALGNIFETSGDTRSIQFLTAFRNERKNRDGEVERALVGISPEAYKDFSLGGGQDWRSSSAIAGALTAIADLEKSEEADALKTRAEAILKAYINAVIDKKEKTDLSYPAVLIAYAKYQPRDLPTVLMDALKRDDQIIRSTAAGLLGKLELTKESPLTYFSVLQEAFERSASDPGTEASMGALSGLKDQYLKLKEVEGIEVDLLQPFKTAAASPDYLVRRRARAIAKESEFELSPLSERITFKEKGVSRVVKANYKRAAKRKKASAVFITAKGNFTIDFSPEAAPLTVENFIVLARSGYFDGLAIHRVVPNFVMQDGDPRGDGEGGPGWQIRCEINQLPYLRGSVGMALAGKDTGGSQWFVAHSPQPHLDGGYTVFGHVNENGMKIVDTLARGDILEKVVIVE